MASGIEFNSMQTIESAVTDLQDYWNTYTDQDINSYRVGILLDDALYGIGLAIDPVKYKEAAGYAQFKKDLIERLNIGV